MDRNSLGRTIYNALVPTNMRVFGETLLGSTAPITERDFTPHELETLRQMYGGAKSRAAALENEYAQRLRRTPEQYYANPEIEFVETPNAFVRAPLSYENAQQKVANKLASYVNTHGRTSLSYLDYPGANTAAPTYDTIYDALTRSFTDPAYNLKTTLGSFKVVDTPEGPVAVDKYNFDKKDYYKQQYGLDLDKASNWDLAKSAHGPIDFLDMYMIKNNPSRVRDVKIRLEKDRNGK